jgi:hypothetical protein
MNHEEYVLQARQEAIRICAGILEGNVDVLEGFHLLASLRWEVGVDDGDPDFTVFVGISSEIDNLPIGEVRKYWSAEALERLAPDLQAAIAWAMPMAIPACRSVVSRFGDEVSC